MDQLICEISVHDWIRQIKHISNTPKEIILEFDTVESERYAEKNIEEKSLIFTTLKISKDQPQFVNLNFTICSTGMMTCGVDPIGPDPTPIIFKLDKDFDNSAFGL